MTSHLSSHVRVLKLDVLISHHEKYLIEGKEKNGLIAENLRLMSVRVGWRRIIAGITVSIQVQISFLL